MRRASAKNRSRQGDWTAYAEDEDFQERNDADERFSHTASSLLAKFNRLTRDIASEDGHHAVVSGFDGTRVQVRDDAGHEYPCDVRRRLKKQLTGVHSPLSIGDEIRFRFTDQTANEGVIVALLPRRNQLARADSHNRALLHVFAANVDRLVVVASTGIPELRPALIDRYLLIAHAFGVEPVVVINKRDCGPYQSVADLYRHLDYPVHCTIAAGDAPDLDGLADSLTGCTCVFAGQSGVGKSSLIKVLAPETVIRIGDVSAVQQKGRHTTTAARSYVLPGGITLIDTPGIRECGVPIGMDALDVALLYRDIAKRHHDCRFPNCSHSHEPDCVVKAAVEAGDIAISRYDSYRAILAEDLA
jgi:ribosome biogenesis GTPase / thiamine phosphate phosphatase